MDNVVGVIVPSRRTEKISENVAREIVHDMRGLEPGTKLPSEAVMLQSYKVGRASLREALRLLEVQGLIVIRPGPGGGPVVAQVDSRHFARMSSLYYHVQEATYGDILQARLLIEPVMARAAAERQDPDDIKNLEEFLAQPTPEDDLTYLYQATGFHALLLDMSGNRVLDLFACSIKDLYTDRLETMVFPPEHRNQTQRDHNSVARAIVSGNAKRAESLMRRHMEDFTLHANAANPGIFEEVIDWH